jgi:hypothetical protein
MNYKQEMYRKMYEKLGLNPELAPDYEYQDDVREEKKIGEDQRRFEFLAPKLSQAAAGIGTLGGQSSKPLQDDAFSSMGKNREAELKAIEDAGIKDNELRKYLAGKIFDKEKAMNKPEASVSYQPSSDVRGPNGEPMAFNPKTKTYEMPIIPQGAKVDPYKGLRQPEKDVVDAETKNMSAKTAIANMIDQEAAAMKAALASGNEDLAITQGQNMLKILNSAAGQDAVGVDEAKRLAGFLEYKILNFTQPGSFIGRDLDQFLNQVTEKSKALKNAATLSKSQVESVMGGRGIAPQTMQQPPQEKVIDGVTYRKVPGGWEAIQ